MSLRDAIRGSDSSDSTPTTVDMLAVRCDRLSRSVSAVEAQLWLLALGAMLLDVILTIHGLSIGLTEQNPIARSVLASMGVGGLFALKFLAIGLGALTWWVVPDRYGSFVPLGLAVPSVAAAVFNAVLITVVMAG